MPNLLTSDVTNDAPHTSYELISLIVNVQEQLRPDHMIIGQTHQLRIQLSQLRVCLRVCVCLCLCVSLCMYVCMHVFVCVVCVCMYMYVYTYVRACVCTCASVCQCMLVYTHVCIHNTYV